MPKEIRHVTVLLDEVARLRTLFTTEGPKVTSYTVQLEVRHDGEWKSVRRSDDHHGRPHIDSYNSRGEQIAKEWLDCGRNEALTLTRSDFKANWERYVAEFLEEPIS